MTELDLSRWAAAEPGLWSLHFSLLIAAAILAVDILGSLTVGAVGFLRRGESAARARAFMERFHGVAMVLPAALLITSVLAVGISMHAYRSGLAEEIGSAYGIQDVSFSERTPLYPEGRAVPLPADGSGITWSAGGERHAGVVRLRGSRLSIMQGESGDGPALPVRHGIG